MNQSNGTKTLDMAALALAIVMTLAPLAAAAWGARVAGTADTRSISQR
jgi:hypothetical protein